MVKYILIATVMLGLVACQSQPPKVEYKEKDVPVYIVPSVKNQPARPDLAVNHLTDQQRGDIGEWTKALTISFADLKTYTCKLEAIVNKYQELAKQSQAPLQPQPATQSVSYLPKTNVYADAAQPDLTTLIIDFNKSCGIQ